MKALIYCGPKDVQVREVPEPVPAPGQAKIRVKYCGVCGSDIGIFSGTHPRARAPLVLGHEFYGSVVQSAGKFVQGDRVVAYPLLSCGHCLACRSGNAHVCSTLGLIGIDRDGGIAEYCCADEDILFKVPDGLSDRAAALIEPLAVVIRAVHQSGMKALDTVAVVGAGPIGILNGLVALRAGATRVYISDVNPQRLEIARSFGMMPVDLTRGSMTQTLRDATGGEGADVLFECSGAEAAAAEMTEITRVSGTICMVAVHKAPRAVNLRDINFKEQTIIGTRVYTKEEFSRAVQYAPQIQGELERVATHIVPLGKSPGVFDLIADPASNTIKVLVDCDEGRG